METRRLEQFRVVAETENLREAAALLHITHAGLAKSLRVLEDDLGVRLLSRDGRNIQVTAAGRRLLREMDACLEAERALRGSARGLERDQRHLLRLGSFEVFSTYLCPELVRALPDGTELVLEELIPGELEERIAHGSVDVGISYLAVPRAGIEHLEVARVRMGVYARRELLGAHARFADLPFVIPVSNVEGSPTKVRGLDGWPDDRLPRRVRYRVTLMESAMALARQGLAAAYLPQFVAERHNRAVRPELRLEEHSAPLKGAAAQPVYLIKRKTDAESGAVKALTRVLRSLR